MSEILLIYPHQLYENHPGLKKDRMILLVEDPLYFTQYPFHKQKLVLHRASMKNYERLLFERGYDVRYIEASNLKESGDIEAHIRGASKVVVAEVSDDWLSRAIKRACKESQAVLEVLSSPNFLTDVEWARHFFSAQRRYFFTSFYIEQRKSRNILLEAGKPRGGKWTFDAENRKKLPKKYKLPPTGIDESDPALTEARQYVQKYFATNPGNIETFRYPVSHQAARRWLKEFVSVKLSMFGDYEDAISSKDNFIYHSVLTPALNIGLISPAEILEAVLEEDVVRRVPLNSLEGFIRQVVGWREYMRIIYLLEGRKQRTANFLEHTRKIPSSFWSGTTGIQPIDSVIRRVLDDAYTHHIERLMILGNFMLLCEFDPDQVYRWFMELFIDAYDWVMVPNVYGMSQYADGGLIITKPYVSGSNYLKKMSDFKQGEWCSVWDGLYWRFVQKRRELFESNPRSRMLVGHLDRMGSDGVQRHLDVAERFLESLVP